MTIAETETHTSVYDRAVQWCGLAETHRCVLERVPPGSLVLEIGPSSGYMTAELCRSGCTVDAIELNPLDAKKAEVHCRRMLVGSAEDRTVWARIADQYEVVLMADVLEHLRSPDEVLRQVRQRIAAQGQVIVSLPNVAHWRMRIDLLRGQFTYTDWGLLDRTHLRFYTRDTALALFRETGFDVLEMAVPPARRTVAFSSVKTWAKKTWPSLLALQIVYRLRPA